MISPLENDKRKIKMLTAETERLLEKTYAGEPLTLEERFNFATYVSFEDFSTYMGAKLGLDEYCPKNASKIVSMFHKKSSTAFERLGLESKGTVTFSIKGDKPPREIETINVTNKQMLNNYLDVLISDSFKFAQITTDYDILGNAEQIKDAENRAIYRKIGARRLDALTRMTGNGGEATIVLKVKEGDQPHAVHSAKHLLNAGVTVYNNENGGECFGGGRRIILKNGWEDYLNKVIESIELKNLSEETGMTQVALKRIKGGERPTPKEAWILRHKYKDLHPEDNTEVVEVQPYAFFINREYFKENLGMPIQAEEPQMHKAFCAIVVENWNAATKWILDYIENKKKDLKTVDDKFLAKHLA